MSEQLMAYPAIGWDFDGTLINHPNSELMHAFIRDQPAKRHVIVTFRTHGMEHTIFEEMLEQYPDAPGPEHFAMVCNIADLAWEKFRRASIARLLGSLNGPRTSSEDYYVEWKGLTCRHHDLPVLIDDMSDLVIPGCEKYGIHYLHPSEL